ncbi:hypothetical protein IWW48_000395 [Coemansia sp. RSA 1200]|nr:hypothetical protein IWW48_000395 [Coemansia sp. RSA 1200]
MDAEMTDVKHTTAHHPAHEEELRHEEYHHGKDHHHHQQDDDHMADDETVPPTSGVEHDAAGGAQELQQYEAQYDESYDAQYDAGEEGDVGIYDDQAAVDGEYEHDPNAVVYENDEAAAAAAVASAVAASVAPDDQEYAQADADGANEEYGEHQQADAEAEQEEYAEGEYADDAGAHHYADQDGGIDDQTLASHPATSREMEVAESMVVDGEHSPHVLGSEVAQAIDRYDYAGSNPDGLETLAATSSAVTQQQHQHQHADAMETPSKGSHKHDPLASPLHMYSGQKPIMPKFNRARNWSTEETKIMLAELERIATSHPDERRESVLRSHSTFEEIAEVLREKGYNNRDGQGCMIRWRNLLRVYKQVRASTADGNPPSNHPNMQYAPSIEAIYHFPPDSAQYSQLSPGIDASATPSGQSRTWSQANGGGSAYETPARKRTRELNILVDNIENIDQKLEQAMEYMTQQNDTLRLLEERLGRTEDALKQSEATIAELNRTFGEKDAKREKLEHQLLATVQALSQVITKKKAEES